jgi:hypothetical protein
MASFWRLAFNFRPYGEAILLTIVVRGPPGELMQLIDLLSFVLHLKRAPNQSRITGTFVLPFLMSGLRENMSGRRGGLAGASMYWNCRCRSFEGNVNGN